MDLSTTLSIVQTILTAIQTLSQLQSVCSVSDCKRDLDDLHNTVQTLKALLQDADANQDSLNSQEKHYVNELKDAVYDADDVLDEFLTLAKRNKLCSTTSSKLSDKLVSFLSRFKLLTHNLSNKVKLVNKRLDAIATKSSKFSFKVEYKPVKFTKEETSSFLFDRIIGRDEDVESIVSVLLGSYHVGSLLAIVGMGGLGKTALAQLVFNDPRVTQAFEFKSWVCVADQDQQQWDLKGLLGKIVNGGLSVVDSLTSLEQIHHEAREKLGGKKYLLVLDDVWTECYHKWQQFEGFLKVGNAGSWIIVTTRSKKSARMIAGDQVHELRGLSEAESWNLFERMAFEAKERVDDDLVELGREIVTKCTNVPLAIRVVGSLLRGQSRAKWLSFRNNGLDSSISERNDTVNSILKLSYDQLGPSLKTCFAYCCIFPKDCEISKQMLIKLWMAQGYINSQNLGEEYFLILLQRCFFQNVHENELGEIKWFKVHDLLHDIAEQVAAKEICIFSYDTSSVGKGVRHLSLMNNCYTQHIYDKTQIRTYLQVKQHFGTGSSDQLLASKSILKWTGLRSLDLRNTRAESLPESISQLLHLRCLDLSWSGRLKTLPKSITKLVNLQTLDLHGCSSLKQLPNDVSKLVDLSTLDVAECGSLSCMPSGIGMLTCLHTLGQFVVGVRDCSSSKQCFDGLEDLQHLEQLKGALDIQIGVLKNAKFVKEAHGKEAYLRRKEHLREIDIEFRREQKYGNKENELALLEEMQPHRDLMKLKLKGYHGETMPRWPKRGDNSALFDLPNLVSLVIHDCRELLCLPWQVGKLPHLTMLRVSRLLNMEYVVDVESEAHVTGEPSSFFPSLDELTIFELRKLKGWWRRRSESSNHDGHLVWVSSPCFPRLKRLFIKNCQKMAYVPVCPRLEHLAVSDSRRLLWKNMRCIPSLSPSFSKPMILRINNLEWPKSMPTEYVEFIVALEIESEEKSESLGEAKELLPGSLVSSLRYLGVNCCPKLRSMGGWLEHLSALQCLRIYNCPNLVQGGIPWQDFPETLQSLCLESLKEMKEVPEEMQCCTSIQSLEIRDCPKLECLPEWMPKLISLRKLQIRMCSKRLETRCRQPNGEDWPLIKNIPLTYIQSFLQEEEKKKSDHEPWTSEEYWW